MDTSIKLLFMLISAHVIRKKLKHRLLMTQVCVDKESKALLNFCVEG